MLSDLVEKIGGNRVRRIQLQGSTKGGGRLVPVPLLEVAAAEARPGRDILRSELDDGGVDARGLVAEVALPGQFEGAALQVWLA